MEDHCRCSDNTSVKFCSSISSGTDYQELCVCVWSFPGQQQVIPQNFSRGEKTAWISLYQNTYVMDTNDIQVTEKGIFLPIYYSGKVESLQSPFSGTANKLGQSFKTAVECLLLHLLLFYPLCKKCGLWMRFFVEEIWGELSTFLP